MPELPEIQALAERLTATFAGDEVARLDLFGFSALKTVAPPPDALRGQVLREVGRRGKYLILEFPELRLLVHLSQGGRVDVEPAPKSTRPKGAVARLRFRNAGGLLIKEFGTERKAALWVVPEGDEGPLDDLGPEPDSPEFEDLIMKSDDGRRLNWMLRDQRTVAGIGRGFADDILHAVQLSPFASLSGLDAAQRTRLVATTREVLREALERERKRTGGLPPKLGDRFAIHNRHGTPCPRCGETMRRISYESHEITYCAPCQTGGKVLADRRMSRLIR